MQGDVYMIAGAGGNTTVQIGREAVVVVDTKTAVVSDQLLAAIAGLSLEAHPARHRDERGCRSHREATSGCRAPARYVRLLDTFDPRGARTVNASIMAHVNVLAAYERTERERAADAEPGPGRAIPTSRASGRCSSTTRQSSCCTSRARTHGRRHDGVLSAFRCDQRRRHLQRPPATRSSIRRGGGIAGILDGLNRILEIAIRGREPRRAVPP